MNKKVVFLYVYTVRNLIFKQSFYLAEVCHTFVKSEGNKRSKKVKKYPCKKATKRNSPSATHQSCRGA